jgi:predicted transcriptional regulator
MLNVSISTPFNVPTNDSTLFSVLLFAFFLNFFHLCHSHNRLLLPPHRSRKSTRHPIFIYNVILVIQMRNCTMAMMSMRLPDDLSSQLDALANATGRSKSFLAGQTIRDYIERESWQIAEITQAIRSAKISAT